MPIQLAGNIRHGACSRLGSGSLWANWSTTSCGTLSGRPVRAVQVGGPLGAYFPLSLFDTPFDYEAFAAKDGMIGHGGVVVFDDTVDMARQARFAMEFCSRNPAASVPPAASVRCAASKPWTRSWPHERRYQPGTAARPLPHDEVWIALRSRRVHPLPRAQRE